MTPIELRQNGCDQRCFEKVFVEEEYSVPFEIDPKFIVDAGANIGMASLFFSMRYPSASILAIEPNDGNFLQLTKNCMYINGIKLLKAALWPLDEPITILDEDVEDWAYQISAQVTSTGAERTIKPLTIETMLSSGPHYYIDLLKLDIEGAEKELFSCVSLDWLDRVGVIAIELHDRFKPGCAKAFYDALHGRNYTQEIRGENIMIKLET